MEGLLRRLLAETIVFSVRLVQPGSGEEIVAMITGLV